MAIVDYADKPNIKGTINKLQTYHTDAYMIAVRNGFKGTEAEWLASLTAAAEANATEKFNEIAAEVKDEAERAKISISNDAKAASEAADKTNAVWGEFQKGVGGAVNAWLDGHPEATTTVTDGSVTKKKIKVGELGYVTSSMLGMTPGDEDGRNISLLAGAINGGFAVYLDGSYTVKYDAKTEISKSVDLRSLGGGHTITFESLGTNRTVFDLTDGSADILINGLNIRVANDERGAVLFTVSDILRSRLISFSECNVHGKIRFLDYVGADIIPTAEDAVKLFSVEKCNFTGIGTKFISCINCAFDLVTIKDNSIHNFSSSFANFGNTNEYVNGAAIREAQKNIVCTNNVVYNDIDWFDNQTSYHCFLLAEAMRLYYSGNTVEGLKSKVKDVPVYDVYASCDEVVYSGNVWKNNITFDAPLNYNALVKIKGTGFVRVINNRFVLEREYIEAVGADIDKLVVNIYDTVQTNSIVFQNNTVDCACLCGVNYGQYSTKRIFSNNIIKAGQWNKHPLFASTGGETFFTNNTVIVDRFLDNYFINGEDSAAGRFIFDNNNIHFGETTKKVYFFYSINVDGGSIMNNKITIDNSADAVCLFYQGTIRNLKLDISATSDLLFNEVYDAVFISSDAVCERSATTDTKSSVLKQIVLSRVVETLDSLSKTKLKYKWDFTIETLNRTMTDSYALTIAKNTTTGLYEVSFVQNDNSDRTIPIFDPERKEANRYELKGNSGGGIKLELAARPIGLESVIIIATNSNVTENIMKITEKVSTMVC